jgi:hypothetical protein
VLPVESQIRFDRCAWEDDDDDSDEHVLKAMFSLPQHQQQKQQVLQMQQHHQNPPPKPGNQAAPGAPWDSAAHVWPVTDAERTCLMFVVARCYAWCRLCVGTLHHVFADHDEHAAKGWFVQPLTCSNCGVAQYFTF